MIAVDAVKRTILLVNRFGLYLCVPAFLIIAYSYTDSTYPQYRVTAKIALKNAAAESAINDIRSKYLVQKAISELPFQASYYDAESPTTEVFGDALPVHLVFDRHYQNRSEKWLRLDVTSEDFVTLTDGDTTAYFEFNNPVNASYGKFKVVHGAVNKYLQASYVIRLEDPARLLDQYYNDLQLNADDNTLTVSILSGNAKKGADLINKLLQLYGSSHHALTSNNLAEAGGSAISNKKFTVLEKPENNVESASISSFWIYFIAALAGLLIPVSRNVIRNYKGYALPARTFNLPKLVDRIHHGFAIKQID
jgi:hypothetical protein